MDDCLRIGLIGVGAMGAQHARIISSSRRTRLAAIVDADVARARAMAERYDCPVAADPSALRDCDGVVVASSTDTHVDIALELLRLGLPILVEKPVATDAEQAARVVDEAARRGVPIMCGFVERFNPVVQMVLSTLTSSPLHIVGLRHSPSPARAHASVVHDLLIHDLDISLRFAGGQDVVRAQGTLWHNPRTGCAEIADCSIQLDGGMQAMLSASRMSQRKLRLLQVTTQDALYEMDLLRGTATVYRHVRHEITSDGALTYRSETVMDIPFVRHQGEPLAMQFDHFVSLIEGEVDMAAETASILPAHRLAQRLTA